MPEPVRITSRDNALLARVRRLTHDPTAYRRLGAVWLEGDHLCRALLARGLVAAQAVIAESAWAQPSVAELARAAARVAIVPDALFRGVSGLDSPAAIGFLIERPEPPAPQPEVPTVVLDRVQDAGNVGSVLRSAAAFGFGQVVALGGTAGLWSPKVLRAGMGAHFGLRLVEGAVPADLERLGVPLLVTSSHGGEPLPRARLPWPCAWVFGHEGQGVQAAIVERASLVVRIPQPGGEESLNVAAAAAICLYGSGVGR
ncbi:MAG: RNA methyltransferase [Burkholderiaceae bacterium]|jgi:TrmH family RNA methyltransferase|nr:RNA methyltransferase [Burkholderiaceae bacterium]